MSAARIIGAAGGRARAEKLSPERRREIAQQAAAVRWDQERLNAWRAWPRRRIPLQDFAALPTDNPMTGAPWRSLDRNTGRWCLIEPLSDFVQMGLKYLPVIVLPPSMVPVTDDTISLTPSVA